MAGKGTETYFCTQNFWKFILRLLAWDFTPLTSAIL